MVHKRKLIFPHIQMNIQMNVRALSQLLLIFIQCCTLHYFTCQLKILLCESVKCKCPQKTRARDKKKYVYIMQHAGYSLLIQHNFYFQKTSHYIINNSKITTQSMPFKEVPFKMAPFILTANLFHYSPIIYTKGHILRCKNAAAIMFFCSD